MSQSIVTIVSHSASRAIGRSGRPNASLVPARSLSHEIGSYSCHCIAGKRCLSASRIACSVGDDDASDSTRPPFSNTARRFASPAWNSSIDAPLPPAIGDCERSTS